MKKKLFRIGLAAVLLGAAALAISCSGETFGFGKKKDSVFSGTIETREIRVGSKVGGRVEAVLVQEGQEVTAGQSKRFTAERIDSAQLPACNICHACTSFSALLPSYTYVLSNTSGAYFR